MPNTNPSAAPLANSCRACGTAIHRGDLCASCSSFDHAENAAWDRAEATIAAREHADLFGDDDRAVSYHTAYEGRIGAGL